MKARKNHRKEKKERNSRCSAGHVGGSAGAFGKRFGCCSGKGGEATSC
jgi:hypothetical protein